MNERLTGGGTRSELRPTLLEYLAVANTIIRGGIIHVKESRRLSKEGIVWYPFGSFCLPIMSCLTGRDLPESMMPFITYFGEYVRQADDLFDKGGQFPSWIEFKQNTRSTQSRLLGALAESNFGQEKRWEMFKKIAKLRRKAYKGFQQKGSWKNDPSFEEAYAYRLETVGTMWETVAELWNIGSDATGKRRKNVLDATIRIGMVFQYLDDFMDIQDDTPLDGNMVRAIINENPEEKQAMEEALRNVTDKPKTMALFTKYAPQSMSHFLKKVNAEIEKIKDISPATERIVSGIVKITLPHIVVSGGDFYKRLQF